MAEHKRLIGLTGPSGSGKSAVSDLLRQKGYPVIDCDQLARLASAKGTKGLSALIEAFGPAFLTEEGELDRRKLGAFVFSDPALVQKLNAVTHPYILALLEEQLEQLPADRPIFLDAPTLFQSGLDQRCEKIVLVTAPENMRVERIMERDQISGLQARQRMAAQMSDAAFRSRCDVILENDGSLAALKEKTEEMLLGIQ